MGVVEDIFLLNSTLGRVFQSLTIEQAEFAALRVRENRDLQQIAEDTKELIDHVGVIEITKASIHVIAGNFCIC